MSPFHSRMCCIFDNVGFEAAAPGNYWTAQEKAPALLFTVRIEALGRGDLVFLKRVFSRSHDTCNVYSRNVVWKLTPATST